MIYARIWPAWNCQKVLRGSAEDKDLHECLSVRRSKAMYHKLHISAFATQKLYKLHSSPERLR